MATFINPRDRLLSDDLCLYKDQEHYKTDHPPLDGDISTDVCIIGGGFTGVMTALHLLKGFQGCPDRTSPHRLGRIGTQ